MSKINSKKDYNKLKFKKAYYTQLQWIPNRFSSSDIYIKLKSTNFDSNI